MPHLLMRKSFVLRAWKLRLSPWSCSSSSVIRMEQATFLIERPMILKRSSLEQCRLLSRLCSGRPLRSGVCHSGPASVFPSPADHGQCQCLYPRHGGLLHGCLHPPDSHVTRSPITGTGLAGPDKSKWKCSKQVPSDGTGVTRKQGGVV